MLEFIEVNRPSFSPNACVCCMGIEGPMIDTHRELPVYGHVYVCLGCVKRAARVLGLAKGKRMDELTDAARALAVAEEQVAKHVEAEEALGRYIEERDQRIAQLEETNLALEGRVEQMKAALKDEAKAIAGVIGE